MNQTPPGNQDGAGRYEIRVGGHLEPRWSTWFEGMNVTCEAGGTTLVHGRVVDQAALHGLLHRLRDTGLPLLALTRVESGPPAPPTSADPTPWRAP